MNTLNIIIPCHNEEQNIETIYYAISDVLTTDVLSIRFHIIFVDDGSTDQTLTSIKRLCETSNNVTYISFTRNFGKEAALYAGIQEVLRISNEDCYTIFMDADLQDPPSLLQDMIKILDSDPLIECVAAKRTTRKGEPPIRSFFSKLFYCVYNYVSETHLEDGARDFCMMRYEMLYSLGGMKEISRFTKGLLTWTGFRIYWLEYENISREKGKSSWSFWKLLKYAIEGIVSFSPKPLELSSILGFSSCASSVILILYFCYKKIVEGIQIEGYALLICLILLLGGIQLLCIGIIGQYLAKIFVETKNRPIFIVRESGGGYFQKEEVKK